MTHVLVQMILFLFVALSVVCGLYVCLLRNREDMAYVQVILFLLSPLFVIKGLFFVSPSKKKEYFKDLNDKLFLN
jgi:hypothetical protein